MIDHSELIIKNNGCIYHLNLHPDEIANTIILVGDPGRVAEVSKYFDRIEYKKENREFITHTGYIGNKRLSVLSTGIGTDNIDIVVNEIDALVNIDFESRNLKEKLTSLNIIRLGTSGAIQKEVLLDSLVVSSFGIGLDNLMHYYKLENNMEEAYLLHEFQNHTHLSGNQILPYIAEGSIHLRNLFMDGFVHGITITSPGFYAPQGRKLRLAPSIPNLIQNCASFKSRQHIIANFEMETAAIYGLGKLLGHHCISINLIIDNRIEKSFSQNLTESIDSMISKALEVIIQI